MERIHQQELVDGLNETMENNPENVGMGIFSKAEKDGRIICPTNCFCGKDECFIEVQVEPELLNQLIEVIEPMGVSPEVLTQRFFEWVADPETSKEAVDWILKNKSDCEIGWE